MLIRRLSMLLTVAVLVPLIQMAPWGEVQGQEPKEKTAFSQKTETVIKRALKIGDKDIEQNQKTTLVAEWTPVKGEAGTFKYKIVALKVVTDVGGNKFTYDSSDEEDKDTFFKPLVGKELTVKVTPKGEVEVVVDKALTDKMPVLKSLAEKNKGLLAELVTGGLARFPGSAEDAAKDWDTKSTIDLGNLGRFSVKASMTNKEKKAKLDRITVERSITYTAPETVEGTDLKVKVKKDLKITKGDGPNEILFNKAENRIEEATLSLKIEGTLTVEAGGQTTDVEINETQTTITKVKSKKAL